MTHRTANIFEDWSSFITDASGEAVQHLQYLPFGESFVTQTSTSWQTRYTFSGKEKDEETGYSYFGARYYASDESIWLSVDPMSDKHPNFTPYAYVYQNPMNLVDPWGEDSIQLNRDGTTKVFATTDDKFDVFVATDKEGNLDRSKTHTIFDKDVQDKRTNQVTYKTGELDSEGNDIFEQATLDEYDIKDYDVAKGFFEFVAQNSDVEWGHTIVGSSKRSIVTTAHMKDTELGVGFLYANKYSIIDARHSHPYGPKASETDRNSAGVLNKVNPKSKLYYIYHKGSYFQYNEVRTFLAPGQIPQSY